MHSVVFSLSAIRSKRLCDFRTATFAGRYTQEKISVFATKGSENGWPWFGVPVKYQPDGSVLIENLGEAKYEILVSAPHGKHTLEVVLESRTHLTLELQVDRDGKLQKKESRSKK